MEKNSPTKYLIILGIISLINTLLYSFHKNILYFVIVIEILWLLGLLVFLYYKKYFKIYSIISTLATVGILCGWVYGFYLPTKPWFNDMKIKNGGSFTAVQIVKDFQANEDSAAKKYPSTQKIEVTGVVKESKIENGKTSVLLNSDDSTTSVFFVLRDSIEPFKTGDNVTLQGICTGFLGDVQFNDGVVIKK